MVPSPELPPELEVQAALRSLVPDEASDAVLSVKRVRRRQTFDELLALERC